MLLPEPYVPPEEYSSKCAEGGDFPLKSPPESIIRFSATKHNFYTPLHQFDLGNVIANYQKAQEE